MAGRDAARALLSVVSALLLGGCLPIEETLPRQHVVAWPEQRLLFVADARSNRVQAFRLGSGAPVALAQTRHNPHARVRDVRLDARGGRLWVLGHNGISVYAAQTLLLERYIPLEGMNVSQLRVEQERVVLCDDSGHSVGEVGRRGGLLSQIAAGFPMDIL